MHDGGGAVQHRRRGTERGRGADERKRHRGRELARPEAADRQRQGRGDEHRCGDRQHRTVADAAAGRLRRNFQGYTDDTAAALIGLFACPLG